MAGHQEGKYTLAITNEVTGTTSDWSSPETHLTKYSDPKDSYAEVNLGREFSIVCM
ncbi:MAG: hypothetical protein KA715_11155 [Xanthomonadaceae bacterium]|nr:hypothetical protein [Xanthomonadaceae bacterium]